MTELDCHYSDVSANANSLGTWLRDRRQDRRLSRAEAARRAGVTRQSWHAWETDASLPQDHNYAGIEDSLEWERGSVSVILAGSPPTPRAEPESPPDPIRESLRETFEELKREVGAKKAQQVIDEELAAWKARQALDRRSDERGRDIG